MALKPITAAFLREQNERIVSPALTLLPERMDSPEARAMILAICAQESRWQHRKQLPLRRGMPHGPARGVGQFERGGGVVGVMEHSASKAHARRICQLRGVPFQPAAVWSALAEDDLLAVCFVRLLLWTDPFPLPGESEEGRAWDYYIRTWRPGKPHRQTWGAFYRDAWGAL